MTHKEIIQSLLRQFDEETKVKVIAQYAEDEFMIPYEKAVEIIVDAT